MVSAWEHLVLILFNETASFHEDEAHSCTCLETTPPDFPALLTSTFLVQNLLVEKYILVQKNLTSTIYSVIMATR